MKLVQETIFVGAYISSPTAIYEDGDYVYVANAGVIGVDNAHNISKINNSDSENGAIILNNNVNANARISAIKDQVVFNTGAAIRFGAADWEYSDWAGLKYDTVANAIYLGIADGTVFNYYSNKRSNGTLKFPGITTITPDGGARIGGSARCIVNRFAGHNDP
jgi:hypothetical protein